MRCALPACTSCNRGHRHQQHASAGIGLFLAIIGFQQGEGLGVVTADGATLVTLGEPHTLAASCMTTWACVPASVPVWRL